MENYYAPRYTFIENVVIVIITKKDECKIVAYFITN